METMETMENRNWVWIVMSGDFGAGPYTTVHATEAGALAACAGKALRPFDRVVRFTPEVGTKVRLYRSWTYGEFANVEVRVDNANDPDVAYCDANGLKYRVVEILP